jgi:hypothetical protein
VVDRGGVGSPPRPEADPDRGRGDVSIGSGVTRGGSVDGEELVEDGGDGRLRGIQVPSACGEFRLQESSRLQWRAIALWWPGEVFSWYLIWAGLWRINSSSRTS